MSFRVYTIKRKRGGREKVQNVHTVHDPDVVERRLNSALNANQDAWAVNDAGEEVGRITKDENGVATLNIIRDKLQEGGGR